MKDGAVVKTFDISGIKAEIQELMGLKFLVVYGFNDDVEKTADEEKVDLIKVKNHEKKPGNSYFCKSARISYYKKLPELIEEVNLRKEKRRMIRGLTELGVVIETEKPVREETFKEWLKIREERANSKERKYADLDWFNEKQEKLTGLFAYLDNNMIGGMIITVKQENGERIASSAFKAAKKEYVKEGINDLMVYQFIIWAIKNRFRNIRFGVDTNFYGYHLSPERFLFKHEWGFKPKPSNELEWVRFLNLEKFGEVCFFISGSEKLECNLLLKKELEEKDIRKFMIGDYGFNKFMIVDNALIPRSV